MKSEKTRSIINYCCAAALYICAAANFTRGNSSYGTLWLCLGTVFLCLGTLTTVSSKKNQKKDRTEDPEEDKK